MSERFGYTIQIKFPYQKKQEEEEFVSMLQKVLRCDNISPLQNHGYQVLMSAVREDTLMEFLQGEGFMDRDLSFYGTFSTLENCPSWGNEESRTAPMVVLEAFAEYLDSLPLPVGGEPRAKVLCLFEAETTGERALIAVETGKPSRVFFMDDVIGFVFNVSSRASELIRKDNN